VNFEGEYTEDAAADADGGDGDDDEEEEDDGVAVISAIPVVVVSR